ncbi:MAG: class I SAM-dependent methyltransferase, partial [Shinella sp.]
MSQLDDISRITPAVPVRSQRLSFGARLLARLIGDIRFGRLRVVLPSGATIERRGSEHGPDAMIVVRNWRMVRRLFTAGDIGFAEGFLKEEWTTPDLTAVIRFAARNSKALSSAIEGNLLMRFVHRISHLLNANTRKGSRRNIEAHYDLGNSFYKEWLDPTMLYSSAIYDETTPTLEAAQQNRLDRIGKKLALKGGESVLEIGCGWGALAVELATKSNSNVLGITLSPSQLAWAQDLAAKSGLAENIKLRLQDYRDTDGRYDRIVSIEMFEAVGEAYWRGYFDTLKRCLKHDGRAVLQIISIEERRFESYRGSTDFIQKYIFPGGFLPSDKALKQAISTAGLK